MWSSVKLGCWICLIPKVFCSTRKYIKTSKQCPPAENDPFYFHTWFFIYLFFTKKWKEFLNFDIFIFTWFHLDDDAYNLSSSSSFCFCVVISFVEKTAPDQHLTIVYNIFASMQNPNPS